MITPVIDLTDFLKVGGRDFKPNHDIFNPDSTDVKKDEDEYEKEDTSKFALRGMITYYGRHYIAYFYSAKFDTWY